MSCHHSAVHSVHIYDDASAMISRLCGITASSLRLGDAVVIVATPEHRSGLVTALCSAGIDVPAHARDGRYTMVDAGEMLSTFMVNGLPDRDLFWASAGELLDQARRATRSPDGGLTVFGEMVAVLWDQGNKQGAMKLEDLWNDLLRDGAFHLHCAYPRGGFITGDEAAVCAVHSHLLQ